MKIFKSLLEIPPEFESDLLFRECNQFTDFMEYFGGYIFLIENPLDLKEIKGYTKNGLIDITEGFIHIDFIRKEKNYYIISIFNNNSGGPTYILPTEIYNKLSFKDFTRINIESNYG